MAGREQIDTEGVPFFSALKGEIVTPGDTADDNFEFGVARALYVGVSGDVAVVDEDGDVVVYTNVPVGVLPVRCIRINDTNTDAEEMVAML